MKASNPIYAAETGRQIERLHRFGWYHSIELPDGTVTKGHQSVELLKYRLAQFDLPERMDRLRVLDIGAWDGWFTFEMERRGAEVTAIDLVENPRFLEARAALGSRADYRVMSVYQLDPNDIGRFDIVLFFGVLYHLKHPLLGLERVCSVAKGIVCVESFVSDDGSLARPPSAEFYEGTELCGQFDNWCGPSTTCLLAWCRTAGLVDVRLHSVIDQRAHVQGDLQWRTAAGNRPAPFITHVENATSRDLHFRAVDDPYVALWFKSTEPITPDIIYAEFGTYAARAVRLDRAGEDGWHAVFKMPIGLAKGWIPITLRLPGSAVSAAVVIGLDVTETDLAERSAGIPGGLLIEGVTDGYSWQPNAVDLHDRAAISLWVRGLAANANPAEVRVRINGADLAASHISASVDGVAQVNVLLPSGLADGGLTVNIVNGGAVSPPAHAVAKRPPAY